MTKSHRSHASVQPRRHHHERRHNRATILAWLSCLCLAATLTACGGGGGGSDDDGGSPDTPASQAGLTFTYPVDGQQDVYVKSQVVLSFDASAGGFDSLANSLTLVADGTPVNTVVKQDPNQPNIFHLQVAAPGNSIERPGLQPSTDYAVAASGGTLITFSTRALDGHPSPGGNFSVKHYTSIGNIPVPFTVFNPIRAHFSQPVNAGTVNLCRGGETLGTDCTVKVSGPSGNVPGTLMILGSDMTFDPDDGTDTNGTLDPANYTGDLQAGKTYTVAFDGVESVFGGTLNTSFNVTPVSIGQDVVKALTIEPTVNKNSDSPVYGGTRNVAHIVSQLIGANHQDAKAAPQRGGLLTRLSEPSDASRYQGTFPAVIPAGQQFMLSPISLKLGGKLQTPVVTGPIQSWFINDASVYIVGNSLSGLKTPTMVLLRFDLAISTKIGNNDPIKKMANGVFNQTILNIVAAGTAIPQENGDVKLVTMGSFPAAVNRTGNAITDFELEVTLPNPKAGNPVSVGSDQTPPRITAVYPSACLYTWQAINKTSTSTGDPARPFVVKQPFVKGGAIPGESGSTTLSDIERDCRDVMSQRTIVQADDPGAPDATMNFPHPYPNGLPLDASPSIIFSEPIDPASLEGNIVLTADNGGGMSVDANLRVEGAAVVIDPMNPLEADTKYTITVRGGLTDLAGNGLVGNFPNLVFNTETMVIPADANGDPIDLAQDLTQRQAVRQVAPFLTVLTPGVPCPLMQPSREPKVNFRTGGDIAGRCVGDNPTLPGDWPPSDPIGITDDPSTPQDESDPASQILIGLDQAVVQFPPPVSPKLLYPVFQMPANKSVKAFFSKPVQAGTIVYADKCLINGSGNTGNTPNATVAVQAMNVDGSCNHVVPGELTMLASNAELTEGFSFRPTNGFKPEQRYWIVVCGSPDPNPDNMPDHDLPNSDLDRWRYDEGFDGPSNCATQQTILGQNGLRLNTNPLFGTGTRILSVTALKQFFPTTIYERCGPGLPRKLGIQCFDDNRGQGGADIVMPFTATAASPDFYTVARAAPVTDTNANGYFDNVANISNFVSAHGYDNSLIGTITNSRLDSTDFSAPFPDAFGRERAQSANSLFINTSIAGSNIPSANNNLTESFLAGGLPVAIGQVKTGSQCQAAGQVTFDDGTPVVGSATVRQCLPVRILPGGRVSVTNVFGATGLYSGRITLRFPGVDEDGDDVADHPQTGYIVPECQGTDAAGRSYHYTPCFVVDMHVTLSNNHADGLHEPLEVGFFTRQGPHVYVPQQDIVVATYGPVAFEQNGRMVISTINANTFASYVEAGILAQIRSLPVNPGGQALQLVTPPPHGGLAFPSR